MPLEPSQLSALLMFPKKRCSGMEEKEKRLTKTRAVKSKAGTQVM
jgi:hypothetical protein